MYISFHLHNPIRQVLLLSLFVHGEAEETGPNNLTRIVVRGRRSARSGSRASAWDPSATLCPYVSVAWETMTMGDGRWLVGGQPHGMCSSPSPLPMLLSPA